MKIEDALKKTGKARRPKTSKGQYAYLKEGILHWKDGSLELPVILKGIIKDDWMPYHEVKEIRPEKAGELWQLNDREYYHTDVDSNAFDLLVLVGGLHKDCVEIGKHVIHNKNGWTRHYPHVLKNIDFHGKDGEVLLYVDEVDSLQEAKDLAIFLQKMHYPESIEFEPLDTFSGVISQIDNMTTGLCRKPDERVERVEVKFHAKILNRSLDNKTVYECCLRDGYAGRLAGKTVTIEIPRK